jgi:hypothetical protein
MERAFHARGFRFGTERVERFGVSSLGVVDPSPEEIRALVQALRAGSPRPGGGLRWRARALARAASRFLDPGDAVRRRALDALPAITGFSPAMIEAALPRIFSVIDERSIEAVAESVAVRFVPLLGIVSAGNIPGVALPQAVLALAAGSSCIVKTASGEPLLMALFAEALGAVSPDVAASLAVVWWRGGSVARDRALAVGVDSLVVYGSDDAVAAWSAYGPRRMLPHGHRASVAVVRLVDDAATLSSLAAAAAADVAMYDQLGCLSPQCLFAIGSVAARNAFVGRLAAALDAEEHRMPLGRVPDEHAILIRRLRDEYEWREIRGEPVAVLHGAEPARWTIVADEKPEFRASPLYRTIVIRRVASASDLSRAIGAWLPRIESAGIGPWPDPEVLQSLAGIPRRVPLGTMQSPDLGWRQGGVGPMAAIIDGKGA